MTTRLPMVTVERARRWMAAAAGSRIAQLVTGWQLARCRSSLSFRSRGILVDRHGIPKPKLAMGA
ncbi:unnamed protein product [Dicrocoelium dendriticum]|nr:unnamed protein product [Dicrocoelium dendriticum]